MKKKIIITILIAFIICLIPLPSKLKDGGTIEYKAVLYTITKYHTLINNSNKMDEAEYKTGIKIEMLGFNIYEK